MKLILATARCLSAGLLFSFVSGCSPTSDVSRRASISPSFIQDRKDIEVAETIEEQSRNAVLQSATSFPIPFVDNQFAWERAQVYFEKYLRNKKPPTIKIVGNRFSISDRESAEGDYTYEILRDSVKEGYRYAVFCYPRSLKGSRETADVNAHNLSRFIKDGRLEVSLLTK